VGTRQRHAARGDRSLGCRVIVTQQGDVDLVHDRVDQVGDDVIFDLLTAEFPVATLRQTLGGMLPSLGS